jgi:hypothetical protein
VRHVSSEKWKPFTTAPKDRKIYVFDLFEGIELIEWREPGPHEAWKGHWSATTRRDDTLTSSVSIYSPKYLFWCDMGEIEPTPAEQRRPTLPTTPDPATQKSSASPHTAG